MEFTIESGDVKYLFGIVVLFWLLSLYFVKDYGYWQEKRVAHVPAIVPLGSLPKLALGKCTWSEALANVYRTFPHGRYVGFLCVSEPCLLIRDPKLIERVLDTDFESFADRIVVTVNPKDFMAHNLYNMKGPQWKIMKSKLIPAYSAAKTEMMYYLVRRSSANLLSVIDELPGDVKIIDTKDLLSRLIMDIIAKCSFGDDTKENNKYKFFNSVKRTLFSCRRLLKIFALKSFPICTTYHFFDFLDPDVKTDFCPVIANAVEYREKNNIDRHDVLGIMMQWRQFQNILEEGELTDSGRHTFSNIGLTMEEIMAEMRMFIWMAHESTADTCLFCLYELAGHEEVQEKLFAEVTTVLVSYLDLTYQALQHMPYLDQVINEVIRLYPVFPVMMRNCTQNYEIPDSTLVIEKGVAVYIPVSALHRDPKYFRDPDTFDPDRFSPDNKKNIVPFTFLPFGAGPRTCMGVQFGLTMVKSALASIVSRYVVERTPETEVPLVMKKTTPSSSPDKPVKLRLTPRLPAT